MIARLSSALNPDPWETFPSKKVSAKLLGFILKEKIQQVMTTQGLSKANPNPCWDVFSSPFIKGTAVKKKVYLLTSMEMQKMEVS